MTKIVELIDEFKLNQEIQGRKKDYIYQCIFRLNRFKLFVMKDLKVDDVEDIKPIHIKQYIKYKQEQGKENNRTINNNLATLKVFFQYLIDEEFIDEDDNPMKRIKNLKEDNTVIVTFNDDEVARIISDVKEETYSNVRDKLILIVLFETGIRVSELCNIKESDISTKHILIHGKGSKQRLVHITKLMRRYMRKFESLKLKRFKHKNKEDIEDYYFLDQSSQKLHRSRINKILKEHCENAKVRREIRCSPHDCRHYYAQKSLKNGIDVYSLSRLMGHYDSKITGKYLRGLEQDDILTIGKLYSPLNDVKL